MRSQRPASRGVRQVSVRQPKTIKNDQNGQQTKSPVPYGFLAESPGAQGGLICLHTAEVGGSNPPAPTTETPYFIRGFGYCVGKSTTRSRPKVGTE